MLLVMLEPISAERQLRASSKYQTCSSMFHIHRLEVSQKSRIFKSKIGNEKLINAKRGINHEQLLQMESIYKHTSEHAIAFIEIMVYINIVTVPGANPKNI